MLRLLKKVLFILVAIGLIACNKTPNSNEIKVGVIAGPETELMEAAAKVAKEKYNLDVKIIQFTDYIQPNAALNDGSIDANMFQHRPFLEQQIKDRHYNLREVGETFVFPMGIYSQKIKNLQELPQDAVVAIPNDPTNEARALLLLKQANLIQLKEGTGFYATPVDIMDNPKHLKFKELDAAQLPRTLPDVAIGVINSNYAIPAGLSPSKDAIFHENKDSPYANLIVVRESEIHDPRITELVAAVQSPEVEEAAKKIFNDQAIPAWQ